MGKRIKPLQKKPNSKKNFFQNYNDHLKWCSQDYNTFFNKLNQLSKEEKFEQGSKVFSDKILGSISVFDPLRDGYDYFDEVVDVAVSPFVTCGAIIFCLGQSILKSVLGLAERANLLENSGEDHFAGALNGLLFAGMALVLGGTAFIKSAVSLFSRPLITAISGFKPQDKERFYDEDSLVSNVNSFATNLGELF